MLWLFALLAWANDDALRGEVDAASRVARVHYNQGAFDDALNEARKAVLRAQSLPPTDPVRWTTQLRVGDALYGLGQLEAARDTYQALYDAIEEVDLNQLVVLVECVSSLAVMHHHLGDLDTARARHEEAWGYLVENQVNHPVKYVVASQFAELAVAQHDVDTALTLRQWVVTSLMHDGASGARVAAARQELGEALLRLGRPSDAMAPLQAALDYHDGQDPSFAGATVRSRVAEVHLAQYQIEPATRLLQRARADLESLFGDDPSYLFPVLGSEANLASLTGDHHGALAANQAILQLQLESQPDAVVGIAMQRSAVARCHRELGDFPRALREVEQALADLTPVLPASHPKLATVRSHRALIHLDQGLWAEGLAELEAALAILQAAELPAEELIQLKGHRANALRQTGDVEGSHTAYLTLLSEASELLGADHPTLGGLHNGYGAYLLDEGRPGMAIAHFDRALTLYDEAYGDDHVGTAGPYNNRALARQQQGDFIGAQADYERVLTITETVYGPDHVELGAVLSNLASLHHARGDFDGALRLLHRALGLREQQLGSTHPDLAWTLLKMGGALYDKKQFDEARPFVERALTLMEAKGKNHPNVSAVLNLLADLQTWDGEMDAALLTLDRSIRITTRASGEDAPGLAYPRAQQMEILSMMGRVDDALALGRSLLKNLDSPPSSPARMRMERRLAGIEYQSGDVEGARTRLASVLDREEARLHEVVGTLSERERLALARGMRSTLFEVLRVHEIEGGDPEIAYEALLRFKGIASRSLAVEQPASLAASDPDTFARWKQVREQLGTLVLGEGTSAAALDELTEEKETLRRTLAERSAAGRVELEKLRPIDICKALPKGAAMVDFVRRWAQVEEADGRWIWQHVYTAFVSTTGCAITRVELGAAEPIERAITKHRQLLASLAPTSRIDRQGAKVRAAVWDPILAHASAEDWYVVPDGAIATVSFASLPDGEGDYLVRHSTFRTLDSAFDARPRPAGRGTGAVVVGGVDYGTPTGPQVASRSSCASAFPPLPGTADEANELTGLLKGAGPVTLFTGEGASQDGVGDKATTTSILHLATHGFFATGACRSALASEGETAQGMNPMVLSGVALAGANDDPASIWTAEEIATLPLGDVDLVVLSACESGLGEIEDGEGVMGLRRAFSLSGARASVMSLWPVDNEATRVLMASFYEALLADPARDESAALRTAQLKLLDANLDNGEARPESWAAFTAAGAPRKAP